MNEERNSELDIFARHGLRWAIGFLISAIALLAWMLWPEDVPVPGDGLRFCVEVLDELEQFCR